MKTNTVRWWGVAVALAAAVVCWYLLTMEPDAASRKPGPGPRSPALVTGNGAAVKPSLPWPAYRSDEFHRTLVERGGQWLDARGRDAEGLIILFDLIRDNKLLDEARQRFPEDPRVCRSLIQYGRGPAEPWIERLLAVEPLNPDVFYLKAWTLLTKKWNFGAAPGRAGAIEALRLATAHPLPRDDYMFARMEAVRDTALELGIGPGDAVRMALNVTAGHLATHQMLREIMKAVTEERAEAKAAGDEARYRELTKLGLDTLYKFEGGAAGGIMRDLEIANQKAALLAEIPDDTEMDVFPGFVTAGDWKQANEAQLKALEEFGHKGENIAHLLATASDKVMEDYFTAYMNHGWQFADNLLLTQAEEAQ